MASEKAGEVTETVFDLYRKYGGQDYLGESVSQSEHAIQCAMQAEKEGAPTHVILGALLHDIGHLSGQEMGQERMVTGDIQLGIQDHDAVGEQFLKMLGVPEEATVFVRGHVDAKRYLTYKDHQYRQNLSDASKMTLVHQGGSMGAEEAAIFEKHPQFQAILRMRTWDEAAKDNTIKMEPLEKYKSMFQSYMETVLAI